jgi:hypothetical protein
MGPLTNIINRSSLFDMIVQSVYRNWYYSEPELINTVEFAGLESFENNLNTLIELCGNDKTKILLMTEPNIYHDSMNDDELNALHMLNTEAIGNGKQWSLETAKTGLTAYNEKIKEISNSKGTMFIDLEKKVPKTLEYFYDDVHYKDKTYDLISDYIAIELNRLKPWKK